MRALRFYPFLFPEALMRTLKAIVALPLPALSRMPTTARLIPACATALLLSACSADQPTDPSSRRDDEAVGQAPSLSAASANARDNDDERDRRGWLQLVSLSGPGRGRIRATRIDHPTTPGNFAVHIEIQVRRAQSNTTYLIQRAPEVNPPFGINATTTDGFCQRGLDVPPWSAVTPNRPPSFLTFPVTVPLPSTAPVTLTTDKRGSGELEFDFAASVAVPAFDVMFRLLEVGSAPRSVLVSECTTMPPEAMD
jgi:hypothetical protein